MWCYLYCLVNSLSLRNRVGSSRMRLCGKCKMNIRPPNGETEWCHEVCDALDRLKGSDFNSSRMIILIFSDIRSFRITKLAGTVCMVKIENREGSPDAPQDYIYSVDLLFAGEESLFEYFVENQLAVKVRIKKCIFF